MRPFGCLVTILNTLDPLGKLDGKVDEGFLVGYSVSSKAFRVFNSRTRIVQETLHINFLENKPNVAGSGPTWLFDIDTLTRTMNYQPVTAGNQSNPSADAAFEVKESEFEGKKPQSEIHVSSSSSTQTKKHDDKTTREAKGKSPIDSSTGYRNLSTESKDFSINSINEVHVVDSSILVVGQIFTNSTNTFSAAGPFNAAISLTHGKSSYMDTSQYPDDPNMPKLEDITYSDDEEDVSEEADFTNLETTITVYPIPTTRVHKDHSMTQIIDASEGFDQIIDFLNGSLIKYALTVNPNIYVSCIKQFWSSVLVKKVNDVMRLQALFDKKKVIITEATIREALRLDDAESIDCLPNEEIFTELLRMGYEKPSTKLTFYKAFSHFNGTVICLSTGKKFDFSKYIFDRLVRNVDSFTKFYMFLRFLQLMIRAQVGDLSSHSTKYSSPSLTQKVFANIRRVEKGFFGVDTPLFEGMIMAKQDDHVANEGAASVAVDDVTAGVDKPSIPSPTPTTQPPPPSQELPSTSQVQPTTPPSPVAQPPSPQQQTQPSHDAKISMDILHTLLETCTTLTRRVEHLEQDKITQTLEITKLKQSVKKLERRNKLKVSKLRRLKKVGTAQKVDTSEDTVMDDDVAAVEKDDEIKENADFQGRQAESQAQIYQIDLKHTDKVLSMQDDDATVTPATTPITVATITAVPSAAKRRKGVDDVIDQVQRKEKEYNVVMRYQALKRKPQTEAHTRKNMMIYLRNMTGFKMDYFKGMSYDDNHLIFEKKFNSNMAFLEKTREQMEEEDIKALKRASESQAEKAAKKQKLDEEVEELKKHLQIVPNNEDDVYIEATPLARKGPLFLSFLSLLRNFDREDLEVLWQFFKERFASSKPKNFSDDFLVTTLTYMFEKPDVQAQVWKNQMSVHGLAKVKSWRLLDSYEVHIITFTTTQMILLVERRYPLTRFTLDQMLNNFILEVEEESEVSLELLRFDLYPVMAPSPIPSAFLVSQQMWHQRLGHPGSEVLRRLVSNNVISCTKEKPPVLFHALCGGGEVAKMVVARVDLLIAFNDFGFFFHNVEKAGTPKQIRQHMQVAVAKARQLVHVSPVATLVGLTYDMCWKCSQLPYSMKKEDIEFKRMSQVKCIAELSCLALFGYGNKLD
nr:ribonuclease H-like domain-containing protein [Tanacetum cinerariifolium]